MRRNLLLSTLFIFAPWNPGHGAEPATVPTAVPTATLQTMHRDKAGLYVRLGDQGNMDLHKTHPLLDAVVLGRAWGEVETRQGSYAFDSLLAEVESWGAGKKGVVLNLLLYGQHPQGLQTPDWIYRQPGARAIPFSGGGQAKGERIQIPAVWEKGFAEKYLEPLIAAYARVFDGHPSVWHIMPGFGHIGNMNCQPSADGSRACLEAGWTPEQWMDYCRNVASIYQKRFKKTPLLLKAAGQFLRNRERDNYEAEASLLLSEMARRGIATIKFGMSADPKKMLEIHAAISDVIPFVERGTTRLGLGDDWPLWVPEHRREEGPNRGFGDDNLRKLLDNGFGGIHDVPKIPLTILFCQEPEILASHPRSKDHQPHVAELLKKARERLKAVELEISGKR